jgi:hypothetical protein
MSVYIDSAYRQEACTLGTVQAAQLIFLLFVFPTLTLVVITAKEAVEIISFNIEGFNT